MYVRTVDQVPLGKMVKGGLKNEKESIPNFGNYYDRKKCVWYTSLFNSNFKQPSSLPYEIEISHFMVLNKQLVNY